ncbi:MAG TPA: sulfur transferase domain-containing protein [Acidobacteriota bacterium]|nr:sulfur transferase domain-containing protein [Acidobacteriota bacterium]
MRYRILIVLSFCTIASVFAFPSDLPNFYQLREQVFTSGQPSSRGYAQLEAMGIQTVINVLPEEECDPGEATMVGSHNMVYIGHPFHPTDIQMETVVRFSKLLKYAEKPVLIHCSTGNHVGGLWVAYRVTIENAPLDTAILEGRQIGMQPSMEDLVLHWLAEQK